MSLVCVPENKFAEDYEMIRWRTQNSEKNQSSKKEKNIVIKPTFPVTYLAVKNRKFFFAQNEVNQRDTISV